MYLKNSKYDKSERKHQMKSKRKILYFSGKKSLNEFTYSGITFNEFLQLSNYQIDNIMISRGGYDVGIFNKSGFPVVEGRSCIAALARENIYDYGDFCFVDYPHIKMSDGLTNQEIAEILFLFNMFKPLLSPFPETLESKIAYLSHDDGHFCRLYLKDELFFYRFVANKLQSTAECLLNKKIVAIQDDLLKIIEEMIEEGMFIDCEDIEIGEDLVKFKFYLIGREVAIDDIYNYKNQFKSIHQSYEILYHRKWIY
jgi:hypothetical protein